MGLQSLSILMQNVRRETSMIYLLSGGLLNTFFDDPPKLDDEELNAYFVTLLKGLALRLTADNAQLCLVDIGRPSSFDKPWELCCNLSLCPWELLGNVTTCTKRMPVF